MAGESQPPPPSVAAPSAAPSTTPSTPPSSSSSSPYAYAYAPDIIRAHQKDAYFQGLLTNQVVDLHRRLLGARSAHAWAAESRTLADLLYLCLTTLLGNRTLGEEYCGLVQVEASVTSSSAGALLPALPRRAAYIAGSILFPYGLTRILPKIRARIRARLQKNLGLSAIDDDVDTSGKTTRRSTATWSYRLQAYLLAHLTSLTSPAPAVHALGLAFFYFTGSYYELAKRLTGLRYVFARRVDESSPAAADRAAGYELLGVLLVVQMAVQGYLHARSTLSSLSAPRPEREGRAGGGGDLAVSLDPNLYTSNNSLLPGSSAAAAPQTRIDLAAATRTPLLPAGGARSDLADDGSMRWIKGAQQRKCTLCLEELKDPAATQCGHVFCWACIGDWVREKPECPLCRREALVQHILPLRAV
ncbi:Pex12 amino terminal region-domain-containing protein [Hypoxylon sp. FL1284]|nr:Pex12 amino terminal region-domain-containing protein [Hypoxylon sp. FL1284]